MTSKYTFFLKFNDYPQREIQVFEAFGMDGFTFAVKQKEKSWARDVYKFNEDTELRFVSNKFSLADAVQYDINGNQIHYLSHGFDFILDALNENGAEASIEFIIKDNGVEFLRSDLDFEDYDSDNVYELKCKTIENNKRSKFKINKDIDIDLFTDKDLDGNSITPLTPLKVLLQSKPIEKFSKWIQDGVWDSGGPTDSTEIQNPIRNQQLYGIETSLVWFDEDGYSGSSTGVLGDYDYVLIEAKGIVENITVRIRATLNIYENYASAEKWVRVNYNLGDRFADPVNDPLSTNVLLQYWSSLGTHEVDISFNIPLLNQGQKLRVYFTKVNTKYTISNGQIDVVAKERTIDTVIDCTRWIDGQKQASIIASGLPLNSPRWDLGGKYYDYVIASGYGIRGILDKPFTTTAEKILDSTMFLTGDYQITEDSVECGTYVDFYGNNEIGRFLIAPDESFSYNTNKRYRIKTFGIKNTKYEQDRDEENTLDAIHTEMQQKTPNFKAKNTKLVTVDPIIDAYSIESARRLGLDPKTKNTSLVNDNDIYLFNITPILDTLKSYTGVFLQQVSGSELKILSTGFAWTVIGIVVGDIF